MKPKKILITPNGHRNLLLEKAELEEKRPEAVKSLQVARDMGDRSENGAYTAARFKLNAIDRRLRSIDRILNQIEIVESKKTGVIDIGSKVTVADEASETTYEIVGGYESNLSSGKISYFSPLGKALLGKKESESVTFHSPSGVRVYKIIKVN